MWSCDRVSLEMLWNVKCCTSSSTPFEIFVIVIFGERKIKEEERDASSLYQPPFINYGARLRHPLPSRPLDNM